MPRSRVAFVALLSLGSLATAEVARSQQLIRLGGEFAVNVHTPGQQILPDVAMDSDGDFVVTWWSFGQDGDGFGVFARRFDATGIGLGGEFQVNVHASAWQRNVAAGMAADGEFVIVWASQLQDGDSYGIFARRFDSAGGGLGSEFLVNTYTAGSQWLPAVDMDADGDFVVAWQSPRDGSGSTNGIFAQRFNSAGGGLGAEFQVNTYTSSGQEKPAVGMDSDGDFVVAWESFGQDAAASRGVFARRFNAAGGGLGAEFQVNAYTPGEQQAPKVALDGNGDFVVAWESSTGDGSGFGVFARRFNAAGAGLGPQFQVSVYTLSGQGAPAVMMGLDGDFVIAWESDGLDGDGYGVFARRFNAAGLAVSGELQVNSFATDRQGEPAVGGSGSKLVVAWQSDGQDGGSDGVFAQRFVSSAVLDIDGNGSTGALTDGILVLRFLFGFTGASLVAGAVDLADCTRCGALNIQSYLQTLI